MKTRNITLLLLFTCILPSCKKNYTPRPRGYLRIEPPAAQYVALNLSGLPCGFNISTQAAVEMSPDGSSPYGFNIDYPNLHAKIYCSYQPVTPRTFRERENECRRLVERTAGKAKAISEQFYENKDRHVYGSLFRINGETPAPVQFILTDSVSGIFRGALYHEYGSNVDSLAPVTEYIREDIIELFLTFYWKK